jgi:CheY-like chemotaxis protein
MNGLQLYDHLQTQEAFQHIPTVFISANLSTKELEPRRVYLIRKPFELEDLLHTIEQIFSE